MKVRKHEWTRAGGLRTSVGGLRTRAGGLREGLIQDQKSLFCQVQDQRLIKDHVDLGGRGHAVPWTLWPGSIISMHLLNPPC